MQTTKVCNQRQSGWMNKKKITRPIYRLPLRTHFKFKNFKAVSEGTEKGILWKRKSKESWVAILISDKIDLKKTITKYKESHYITIKGLIQREDIIFMNIHVLNMGTHKNIKQILRDINEEIDSNTIILGTLISNLHHWIDHPDRKSTKKHH